LLHQAATRPAMSTTDILQDPLPAVTEANASPEIAEIFSDIRNTLDVSVVNLIWRHLATMPGALDWVWTTVKPLYVEYAPARAKQVLQQLPLPKIPVLSQATMMSAGINEEASSGIRSILDSYYHTNALALVCLSAFYSRFASHDAHVNAASASASNLPRAVSHLQNGVLPPLPALQDIPPAVRRLVYELNSFGEDSDATLIASMYRHLSHWPPYLSLIRTLLIPLHLSGELSALTTAVRQQGEEHGCELAQFLPAIAPVADAAPVLNAVARFVRHPISRMTAICAILREVTP
jgi:hypothetical protein